MGPIEDTHICPLTFMATARVVGIWPGLCLDGLLEGFYLYNAFIPTWLSSPKLKVTEEFASLQITITGCFTSAT